MKMLSKLLLFLLSTWLFIIPPSNEVPDTRANGEDGLDKILEQLLGKFSAAERARGNEMAKAERARGNEMAKAQKSGRNIPEKENRVETVVNVGDSKRTRVDVTENGQIVEQHYRDCDERNEVIVMKPGTPNESCFIHNIDDTQYAYDCEKKGKKVEHTYKIHTDEIKDKAFLKEALGSSVCQDAPLYKMEIFYKDQVGVPGRELKIQRRDECGRYCCVTGWWGLCLQTCYTNPSCGFDFD